MVKLIGGRPAGQANAACATCGVRPERANALAWMHHTIDISGRSPQHLPHPVIIDLIPRTLVGGALSGLAAARAYHRGELTGGGTR